MADNQQQQGPVVTNSFNKGMLKDYNETFVGEGLYTHARNAVNNSHDGQVGVIGNEPSNLHCITLPYTFIGAIHTTDDVWVVFSTDDVSSEIGLFDESACTYTKVVNDPCLNFRRANLITGQFRKRYDCERLIYWDDGRNPTRTMDLDNVPFKYTERIVDGCIQKTYTTELNCEQIRMAPLIKHPCLKLKKGTVSGTLPNGSYQVCIAYTVNQVRVSDYIGLSEVQSVWTHQNVSSSLELTIETIDSNFDEFELVVVSNINGQGVAKRLGYYSTSQGTIYIDRWDPELPIVSISDVVFRSTPVERSDAMYQVNNYLLRVGTYSKYKFNYQPLANKIVTKWAAVEYPADYYVKGGNNTSYLRDEQYAYFIRWVYNTGDRSESYHIPGRKAFPGDLDNVTDSDAFETTDGVLRKRWQTQNTATIETIVPSTLTDGGNVIATGYMGYWESTELYPADRPDIWGNLCGKPIRHHKMPDVTVDALVNHFNTNGSKIVLLGVQFENIAHPVDQDGNPIESIVGYEILRGSREGAKSIVASGIFNNMREYSVPSNPNITGLYQNYPYNDLRTDQYLTTKEQTGTNGSDNPTTPTLSKYRQDIFSFHSPEVSFSTPFLNVSEVKIYEEFSGEVNGTFEIPYQHPKFKQITNSLDTSLDILATAISIIEAAAAVTGGYTKEISSDPNLPGIQLGIPRVLAEGFQGTIGTALTSVAIGANIAFQASYALLFGTRISKQQLLNIVLALIPARQFAAQYNSHGFYNQFTPSTEGVRRRKIIESNYVGSSVQSFANAFQINNINRSKFLTVQIDGTLPDPLTQDNSRVILGQIGKKPYEPVTSSTSTKYGSLKISIPSQYGQLASIKQLVISDCVLSTVAKKGATTSTGVMFGGDIYINRFTEKNSMFFFNTWLNGEPDDIEFDYSIYPSMPYPRFWINNVKYIGLFADNASDYRSLDKTQQGNFFYINSGYFYLFNSGVRDFFVESEINLAYRDYEDVTSKRHYDPYGYADLTSMFRSDIIKSGNYYKYDYSLSVSKLFNSQITWGNLLPNDYDPIVASTCYVYRPYRVVYSLPQQDESKKDSWRIFLVNNYKDFISPVTSIKAINKTGALFMMAYQSPLSFMGTEELRMDGTGVKVTIGDGALFAPNQQLQSIVNTDDSYEYASCQNRSSVIGTARGVFWVSQNQGKIFNYAGQLKEISNNGLKWWFAKYLPSQLLKTYPGYPLFDNPVRGVGVQTSYDSTNEIVYFSKTDYKPKRSDYTYDSDGYFYLNNVRIDFTDSDYFEPASFTVSYDTKTETWISFHDWIPTGVLPGKAHFMSVKERGIWKHNVRCDNYCNYYGLNYPFEVEFVTPTGQTVTTMRNIEYILEVYNYSNDCRDKFHVLDANFDQAMIYNSEQISGLLNLNLKSKSNPLEMLTYPKISAGSIDINFSKEENKYRFNQFWDITKDRGEFSGAAIPLINTAANGYEYDVNLNAVNYVKDVLQRKKFRHNVNRVWLRKKLSGDQKFLFKMSNQKLLQSFR